MVPAEIPMTLEEAAQYLRCHPSTLKRRVARREIAVIRRGRLLFRRSDLNLYLDGARSEAQEIEGESNAAPVSLESQHHIRGLGPQRMNPLTGQFYAPEVAARIAADLERHEGAAR